MVECRPLGILLLLTHCVVVGGDCTLEEEQDKPYVKPGEGGRGWDSTDNFWKREPPGVVVEVVVVGG